MADTTKHLPINRGTLISDLKSIFSLVKTRRTAAFIYGFMFAFVGFTVFLALNPSPNSAAPWFTNIFSTSGKDGSSSSFSSRSQFPSIFSYFFPNNTSPRQVQTFAAPPPILQTNFSRSGNNTFQSPTVNREPSTVQNHNQSTLNSDKAQVLKANQTSVPTPQTPLPVSNNASSSPSVNKAPPVVKNQTRSTGNSNQTAAFKANQTVVSAPVTQAADNKSSSPTAKVGSSEKINSGKDEKKVEQKSEPSNYTASLSKKQRNETKPAVSVKQGDDDLIESLKKCDLFDGNWVKDDSYPLYKPGSCSLIDEQFNCIRNGRPDKDYQKFKWKPRHCNLPRLDGSRMLDMLRGRRLVFVGDSLNRNMWESLICILRNSVKDQSKVYEAQGRHHFRGEASYSFIFKDYNCTIEFFVSPFLVQEWEMPEKDGSKKETLRLDLVGRSSEQYKGADIIVFNTGHWWTHDKTSKGKDYYQEGSHVYGELNVLEAFRKALTTWARWVDANVNPSKSFVFFRGYSASHFSGGQWNSGGQCDSESEPIKNETYLKPYPPKMTVLERVLRGMKTHVTYLNITRMTDFRKDGHPSIYRKQNLSKEERRSPLMFQDCSHWCLPGVPDAWNEVLYAELLVKLHNNQQQQQKRPMEYIRDL
ncbi:protein trichome birefringence isoform X2 [Ziziphus jujuba]|uniref:Protein trichome birefringence isoform X2 n=1 Tax=Ziziphus jujuba TaxID=326968 RepID=A0ABM3I6I8_ZIZJJ|nr:protein trichome birefringence isoform X2 [Ziziphus jujuba]